ncbi:hypothetical protein [Actinomadura rayongensis]|uniref:Uncharacterized protein n=1 Tax=Actinomadura rayongensis TaxID=1429076 RepID=A0A6I4W785_9ACTN|nr:hypothetical protein [Actinomadura rayongensis]MXQ66047.1 hypothetical protein [Actinomadura rayongensis]
MRIPKPVNAALDWVEAHRPPLGVALALVLAACALLAAPHAVGIPLATFLVGLAGGGLLVHVRLTRRIRRARAEIDELLRQNGRLRHRNTVLTSGVITRESQVTQALLSIPEDEEPLRVEPGPQSTMRLPELPEGVEPDADEPEPPRD